MRDPLASHRLSLSVAGPARIMAAGNGNPCATEPFISMSGHTLFFGKAVAVVRRKGAGRIELTVDAEGLEAARLVLP